MNGQLGFQLAVSFSTVMKIALFGVSALKLGKHNLKDPRLDEADKLVAADKKTHAQVDVLGQDQLLDADALLTTEESKADLILKDLEFVETRLGRDPQPAERTALEKIKSILETEQFIGKAGLSAQELEAVAAHNFYTNKPITVAAQAELQDPEALLLRAFAEAGYICFLTVGGKENRAWPIRQGATAWEAAGTIHTDRRRHTRLCGSRSGYIRNAAQRWREGALPRWKRRRCDGSRE